MRRIFPWLLGLMLAAPPALQAAIPVPTNVVTRSGDRCIVLHWDDAWPMAVSGYRVYRADSANGAYLPVSSVLTSRSFADVTVANGPRYFYTVRGIDAQSTPGDPSGPVSAVAGAFADDDAFLDFIQHTSFDFFWYEANPANGLIKDRSASWSHASIASMGFGLTAIGVGIDHGWISREAGRSRVLTTLRTLWQLPKGAGAAGIAGYRGWFYHFLDMTGGKRAWTCELSSIDTGLLLAGVLSAKQFFDGTATEEQEIRAFADSLYYAVEWSFLISGDIIRMGWSPESGLFTSKWQGYNEAMVLLVLCAGSNSIDNNHAQYMWSWWTQTYNWSTQYGYTFIQFAPLFGHQYSHCWIDFRNMTDYWMRNKRNAGDPTIDYFENSRRATLAQRAYAVANPGHFNGYGASIWGLTACDGPDPNGYQARGAPNGYDDGTIAPTAAGGSIPFTPVESITALRAMYDLYRASLLCGYGFRDSFNPGKNWFDADCIGIDQGPIVLMIENYQTGRVWKRFMANPIVQNGLRKLTFDPVTAVAQEPHGLQPSGPVLECNYPNPFNPSTHIAFVIPEGMKGAECSLTVYDLLGRETAVLFEGPARPGRNNVEFNAQGLPSGTYVCRLSAGSCTVSRLMVLLR